MPYLWSHSWSDPFHHLGTVLEAKETEKQRELRDRTRQLVLEILEGANSDAALAELEGIRFENDGLMQLLSFMLAEPSEQDHNLMDHIDAILASEGEEQ